MVKFGSKIFLSLTLMLSGCSSIDCPLNNNVRMVSQLYSAETLEALTLSEAELNITAAGTDSLLLNRWSGAGTFSLPLGYRSDPDTLLLHFSNSHGQFATDSLIVSHTATPHFENIDCPVVVFHQLSHVRWTSHPLRELPLTIDSVVISRNLVDYEDLENLRIYLRAVATQ
ncbi:MAG: hypothetical protein IKR63_00880 [Alloprevotella sp.]|nr:hypothetical protein [Alloprevotella sp.]MBR7029481.1 hypothetical protein [Bacteroidaceae bacterium]